MSDDSLIIIGKIVAPHGVRGDIRVIPLTDFPSRFHRLTQVVLDDGKALTVKDVRTYQQQILLKFEGLDDRTAVEPLKGKLIKITKDQLVKLPEGHYFIFDIIGLSVFDDSGAFLGVVTDVLATGSNDVYIAEREGAKPLLIPAIKDVVKDIDVPGGRMIVTIQEEWE
ncbi:MAG: ribosome maturation factor RimM [Negativicutes bacterium]|nr:ribosome maturation factor RimM [Negativicutes bacterium]